VTDRRPQDDADQACRLLAVFLAGKRPGTVRAYGDDLDAWATFLGAADREAAVAALLADGAGRATERVRLYQDALQRTAAPTTVNRRLACLTSLTRTARGIGLIDWRLRVRALPTMPLRDTAGPAPERVLAMLAWARGQAGLKGPRDAAILWLLYGLALRRHEVVGLDVEHVDIERPAVAVMGKRRLEREWLEMPLRAQEAVAEWIVARGGQDGPLFISLSRAHRGMRLTGKGVGDVVKRTGLAVGVETTPHGLRHSAITAAIRAGHPLPMVQMFSRHRDLRTLQEYFDRVSQDGVTVANDVANGLGGRCVC